MKGLPLLSFREEVSGIDMRTIDDREESKETPCIPYKDKILHLTRTITLLLYSSLFINLFHPQTRLVLVLFTD